MAQRAKGYHRMTISATHTNLNRVLIRIEYDGHGLVGWQRQENGASVQAYLEAAAEKLSTRPTPIQGAGRTDAGVHAAAQAAHLDLPAHLSLHAIIHGLNAWLETDQITVLDACFVPKNFNARFDAIKRQYCYRILNRPTPAALRRHYVWHHRQNLHVEAMHEAAQCLIGRHDFTSFRATACQAKSPIRTLDHLAVKQVEDEIHIIAHAQSFLHHQIRNFSGSLAYVGTGKWRAADLKSALEARDRRAGGPTAPAHGLILTDIHYPAALLSPHNLSASEAGQDNGEAMDNLIDGNIENKTHKHNH